MTITDHYNRSLTNWYHPSSHRRCNVQKGGMLRASMFSDHLQDILDEEDRARVPEVIPESYPNPTQSWYEYLKAKKENSNIEWLSNKAENLPHISTADKAFLETWSVWGNSNNVPHWFISMTKILYVMFKYKPDEVRETFVSFVDTLHSIPIFRPLATAIMIASDITNTVNHEFLMINLIIIGCLMVKDWQPLTPFNSIFTAFYKWFMIYVNLAKKLHYTVSNAGHTMQKIEQFWENCKTDIQPLPVDLYEGMYEKPEEEEEVEEKPSLLSRIKQGISSTYEGFKEPFSTGMLEEPKEEEMTEEEMQFLKRVIARQLPPISKEEEEYLERLKQRK